MQTLHRGELGQVVHGPPGQAWDSETEGVLATGAPPALLKQHRDTVCEAAPAKGVFGGIQCLGNAWSEQ